MMERFFHGLLLSRASISQVLEDIVPPLLRKPGENFPKILLIDLLPFLHSPSDWGSYLRVTEIFLSADEQKILA